MAGGSSGQIESEAGMKVVKEGRTITVTFDESDALSRGLGAKDLDLVVDGIYQGMKLTVDSPALREWLIATLGANPPDEFKVAEQQFNERWEILG